MLHALSESNVLSSTNTSTYFNSRSTTNANADSRPAAYTDRRGVFNFTSFKLLFSLLAVHVACRCVFQCAYLVVALEEWDLAVLEALVEWDLEEWDLEEWDLEDLAEWDLEVLAV
jgi:hypothetical protein